MLPVMFGLCELWIVDRGVACRLDGPNREVYHSYLDNEEEGMYFRSDLKLWNDVEVPVELTTKKATISSRMGGSKDSTTLLDHIALHSVGCCSGR